MPRPYDLITFDCYGTLVDWESGIASAFARASGDRSIDRDALLAAHAQLEPAVQAGPYRSYREVLTETAARISERLGLDIPAERASFLADSLPQWPVFSDTLPGLRALTGAGYRLGILSNIDDALLAGTLEPWQVPFDIRVTAEAVRSYKPAPTHFHEAARRIGKLRWLHAAQSWFHDVAPAAALGVPVVWVNRHDEPLPEGARPERIVRDLAELAAWLTGGG